MADLTAGGHCQVCWSLAGPLCQVCAMRARVRRRFRSLCVPCQLGACHRCEGCACETSDHDGMTDLTASPDSVKETQQP